MLTVQGWIRVRLRVSPMTGEPRRRAGVGLCLLLCAGYLLGAWGALHATDVVVDGVKLFAPAGMTLAVLVSTHRRDWPLLLGLVMACELALDTVEGFPWTMAVGFAVANALHPLLSASILRRWGPADPFATPCALLRHLLVAASAGPAVGALVGMSTVALHVGGEDFLQDTARWYLGDAWGATLVGTALLAVAAPRPPAGHRADPARAGERAALLVAVGTVTAGAYFTGSLALRWMMLPLIVLVALRSGLRNTGVAMLLVTAVAEVAVSTGYGLSDGLTRAAALDALQGYLAVTLLCAVLLNVETTRRHRLQRALVSAELERMEANLVRSRHFEVIGQRAGGLAHDFNNLLGVVRNYAEHLLRDDGLAAHARGDVAQIAEAANRGGDLVHRLLSIARTDGLDAVALDLGSAATELVELLRVPMAGCRLEVHREGPVRVLADRVELDRLLLNLLYNARDALAGTGRITVTVRTEPGSPAAPAPRALAGAARHAVLEVADDGVGMAPEVAAQAFDPLFSTKADGRSTGLGLSTVRAIVERHGGGVSLASRSGTGTTVIVRLPLVGDGPFEVDLGGDGAPADTAAVLTDTSPTDRVTGDTIGGDAGTVVRRGGAEVVLVVEADAEDRRAAAGLLHRLGYATVCLADAATALDALARRTAPDIVLCSVAHHERAGGCLDGIELAAEIGRRHPQLPVVLMSRGELAEHAQRDEASWPVLAKPFDPTELAEVLRALLGSDEPAFEGS